MDARVFWRGDLSSFVLPLRVEPDDVGGIAFDLSALRDRAVARMTTNAAEHVLFAEAGRRLQLTVRGDLVGHGRVFAEISDHPSLEKRMLLLRRLMGLIEHGSLPPQLYRADPRQRRLSFVLQALDGWLVQAPQRLIAAALFDTNAAVTEWRTPASVMRDHVRRAITRGRWLMEGGYLSLLR